MNTVAVKYKNKELSRIIISVHQMFLTLWPQPTLQRCTEAKDAKVCTRIDATLHISTLTLRLCQAGILKGFIYCSSNHKFIKCLWMWLICAVMGKRTLHLTSSGVYLFISALLSSDTSLQLPTFIMRSYQVLYIYPNPTADIILVVHQSSLNVPKFKASSCCGLTQIQRWAGV